MFLQTMDTFKSLNVKQTISTCYTFVLHVCGYFYRDGGSVCGHKAGIFDQLFGRFQPRLWRQTLRLSYESSELFNSFLW